MELDRFSLNLIKLTQSVSSEQFYPNLEQLLKALLYFDELLVLQFSKTADTNLLYRYGDGGNNNILFGEDSWKYLTRLYVLDPYYRLFADKNQNGFYSLDDIAPDEFAKTYHSYFNFLELSDEVGFLFPINDETCLHVDLSIFGKKDKFPKQEKQQLAMLFEPLAELVQQHLAQTAEQGSSTYSNVETVLTNFGKELLTKKEYQVCQLLLQGHSTKSIAESMNIGYETVKMHKRNIYGKSLLSSQSELMALFIDILQQEHLAQDIDHLAEHVKGL
jgi:DNA-binding CsgD family transcriptional regulator